MEEQGQTKKLRHSASQVDEAIDHIDEIYSNGELKPGVIPSGAITGPKIAANSITTGKIADGTIQSGDINDNAFDDSLSTRRKLADAKSVGDKLKAMSEKIDGVTGAVSGFRYLDSVSKLPATPSSAQQIIGYIIGTHLYVYVAEGGDTLGGKYKDVGEFKGPKGSDGEKGETGEQGPVGPAGDTTAVEAYMQKIRDEISSLPDGSTTMDAKVIKNEADITDLAHKVISSNEVSDINTIL